MYWIGECLDKPASCADRVLPEELTGLRTCRFMYKIKHFEMLVYVVLRLTSTGYLTIGGHAAR